MRVGPLEALVYSSLWLAAAAAVLCAAASFALGVTPRPEVLALAATGTFVVYTVDRLRDIERDRITAPRRTGFVARWRGWLAATTALCAAASVLLGWMLGARVVALLAPVALLGLAHRRLKHVPFAKAPYVAAAWVAVTVGLPAIAAEAPRNLAWTAGLLFAAILANAVGCNVRDREAAAARFGPAHALRQARGIALAATVAAALAPPDVRVLLPVPALTGLALLGFRNDERYALIVLDGALLAGGLVACALASNR